MAFVDELEKRFEAEIMPVYKTQEVQKQAFIKTYFPNATPLQVTVVFVVTGFLLTKLLAGPTKEFEDRLDMAARRIAPWGVKVSKRHRRLRNVYPKMEK